MTHQDEALLERNGWLVECMSPMEISDEENPENRATGYAVEIIIDYLKMQEENDKKEEGMS